MMTNNTYWQSHPKIRLCVAAMAGGDVIAYPTEAVWGLGCDPFNHHAVSKVLALKKREAAKGLIIVAAKMEQIDFLLEELSQAQLDRLQQSWPGPVTWLVPHRNCIPSIVTGESDFVAVRVSAHPVVKALCERFGGPIVSTSANEQGKRPARSALDVLRYFGHGTLTLAPGILGKSARPSEIKHLITGETLRV